MTEQTTQDTQDTKNTAQTQTAQARRLYLGVEHGLKDRLVVGLERLGFAWVERPEAQPQGWARLVPKRRPYWEEHDEEGPFFCVHPSGVSVAVVLASPEEVASLAEADTFMSDPDGGWVLRARDLPASSQVVPARVVGEGADMVAALCDLLNGVAPPADGSRWEPPPVVEPPSAAMEEHLKNRQWWRAEAKHYAGQWVALLGGRLIAHGKQYRAVRDEAKAQGVLHDVTIMEVGDVAPDQSSAASTA